MPDEMKVNKTAVTDDKKNDTSPGDKKEKPKEEKQEPVKPVEKDKKEVKKDEPPTQPSVTSSDLEPGWKYYIYQGSSSGVTLKHQGEDREIILLAGQRVALPEDHPYTKKMFFNGILKDL